MLLLLGFKNNSVVRRKSGLAATQHMQLMARLLIHLQEMDGSAQTGNSSEETFSDVTNNSSPVQGKGMADLHLQEIDGPAQTGNSSEETCSEEAANHSSPVQGKEMAEFLHTCCFDMNTEAAIRCCLPFLIDTEDLKAPSNGIKLKYDVKQIVSAKWALIVKEDPHNVVAREMKTFLELINLEWGRE